MELYGKDVLADVFESLVGAVVDVDERRNCHVRIQGIGIYDVAVVLGRNVNSSGCQVFDRVVSAAMAVFHLVGICAGCKSHQLMTKTDRKDRHIGVIQFFDFFDNGNAFLRISRAIGQHNSVRVGCKDFFCCCKRRVNRYFASACI